jgi:hypothetical protein
MRTLPRREEENWFGDPEGRRRERSERAHPTLSAMYHVSNLVMGSEFGVGKPKYLLTV